MESTKSSRQNDAFNLNNYTQHDRISSNDRTFDMNTIIIWMSVSKVSRFFKFTINFNNQMQKVHTVDLTQPESFSVEKLPEKRAKYIVYSESFTSD